MRRTGYWIYATVRVSKAGPGLQPRPRPDVPIQEAASAARREGHVLNSIIYIVGLVVVVVAVLSFFGLR